MRPLIIAAAGILLGLALLIACMPRLFPVEVPTPELAAAELDAQHAHFAAVLAASVHGEDVDYAAVQDTRDELDRYRAQLAAAAEPQERDARLAFYINAYNALTLELVLRTVPEERSAWDDYSVKQVRGFWTRYRFQVHGVWMSLDHIEHGILRHMDEPRIHFAVNCASESCPKLAPEPYVAQHIDAQLAAAAESFVASEEHVFFEDDKLYVNPILSWFGEDFDVIGGVREFLIAHAGERGELRRYLQNDGRIRFFDYDWSVNLHATARP